MLYWKEAKYLRSPVGGGAVEPGRALLAVVPVRVVLARALAGLDVADGGVAVTLARDAPVERAVVVLVVVALRAQLAVLA